MVWILLQVVVLVEGRSNTESKKHSELELCLHRIFGCCTNKSYYFLVDTVQ